MAHLIETSEFCVSPVREEAPENFRDRFTVGYATAACEAHPDRNEDAMFADPVRGIFGVFDGISRSKKGQEASHFAQEYIYNSLIALPPDDQLNCRLIEQGFKTIIDGVADALSKKIPDGNTTASFIKVWNNNLTYAHIGDSRVYTFNGNLNPITRDHGALLSVKSAARARQISRKFDEVTQEGELDTRQSIPLDTEEHIIKDVSYNGMDQTKLFISERELFGCRNVLLGSLRARSNLTDYRTMALDDIDLILITSDGIHGNLIGRRISAILQRYKDSPSRAAEELVEEAKSVSANPYFTDANGKSINIMRAKPDDMTAIVIATKQMALPNYRNLQESHYPALI